MTQDVWLTRREVSARVKVPVATLNQWGPQGKGPKYALFGRHARYRLSDVIAWENAQLALFEKPDPQERRFVPVPDWPDGPHLSEPEAGADD